MDISDLKNRYRGQRAFIVANGPSSTMEILNRLALAEEYTFGMNRVAWIYPKTIWRPNFYIGMTTALGDPRHRNEILKGVRLADVAFCRRNYYEDAVKGMEENVAYVTCSDTHDMEYTEATNEFWSDDIAERVSIFGVMAFPTMQIAAYLGFSPIFLIGCDGNYTPPSDGIDHSHLDPGYRPFDAYPDYDYAELNRALLRAHDIAQIAADRLGIEIINLSPISVIKSHPFMSIEEVLDAR